VVRGVAVCEAAAVVVVAEAEVVVVRTVVARWGA